MEVHQEEWVLDMWLETCENYGIEVEYTENRTILRIRVIQALRREGILE
jgi:hypothetical protein